jgi:hypothetical protein
MAKNNLPGTVKCAKTETVLVHASLKGAGAAALTKNEPFDFGCAVNTITRTGVGAHTIAFTDKYPQLLFPDITVYGTTAGLKARFTAIDVAAGTATIQLEVGAVATEAAATDFIFFELLVRNSGQH